MNATLTDEQARLLLTHFQEDTATVEAVSLLLTDLKRAISTGNADTITTLSTTIADHLSRMVATQQTRTDWLQQIGFPATPAGLAACLTAASPSQQVPLKTAHAALKVAAEAFQHALTVTAIQIRTHAANADILLKVLRGQIDLTETSEAGVYGSDGKVL